MYKCGFFVANTLYLYRIVWNLILKIMGNKFVIGIINFKGNYSEKEIFSNEQNQIKRAIIENGCVPQVIYTRLCEVFTSQKIDIKYKGNQLPAMDYMIPRVTASDISIESDLIALRALCSIGVPVLNDYDVYVKAKSKLISTQIFGAEGIPQPRSAVIRSPENIDDMIDYLGGFPIIVKSGYGSLGDGVVIMESRRSLVSMLEMINGSIDIRSLLFQEFIKEAEGKDKRLIVIGDKVIGAMERSSKPGDFRSNLGAGGDGSVVDPTDLETEIAIKTVKSIGADIAGVDLIQSDRGPLVLEVNANVGFSGFSKYTGIDVADLMVKFVINRLDSPKM